MALVPATITVNFISNYAGPHRVCYRIQGSGDPYTCTTSLPPTNVICAGSGAPCQYIINIQVDNETCEEVTYEGYVQAACQTEASIQDRIPFTVTFVPTPTCLRIPVTCNNSSVNSILIDSGGNGYADPADIGAAVTISGDGSSATGEILSVLAGQVSAVLITNSGSGYTSATVSFPPPVGGGDSASGSVILNPCLGFEYESCEGLVTIPDEIEVGETVSLCSPVEPLNVTGGLPENITEGPADGTCLCNCVEVEITNNNDGKVIRAFYIVCGTSEHTFTDLPASSTTNIGCIVENTLQIAWDENPSDTTINVIGACDGVAP